MEGVALSKPAQQAIVYNKNGGKIGKKKEKEKNTRTQSNDGRPKTVGRIVTGIYTG